MAAGGHLPPPPGRSGCVLEYEERGALNEGRAPDGGLVLKWRRGSPDAYCAAAVGLGGMPGGGFGVSGVSVTTVTGVIVTVGAVVAGAVGVIAGVATGGLTVGVVGAGAGGAVR